MTLQIDSVSWKILQLLQDNARLSYRQIGEAIGLTAPAVTERVRRMEEAGLVKGYHAEIDLTKAGLSILAIIHLTCSSVQSPRFRKAVDEMPNVVECHCVTGNESYILKVAVPSVAALEHFLLELARFGDMRTSLVLSTQIYHRAITGDGT